MRDGEANAFGRERQAAHRRAHFERVLGALGGAREGVLASRPGDRTVRTGRDMVDPASLAVGCDHAGLAVHAGRHDLAVVAAGDDAIRVRARAENCAAMRRDRARLAHARHQDERLLAQHQDRGVAEKMRAHDACAGLDRPRALDHGGDVVAGFGHSVTDGAFAHTTRAARAYSPLTPRSSQILP